MNDQQQATSPFFNMAAHSATPPLIGHNFVPTMGNNFGPMQPPSQHALTSAGQHTSYLAASPVHFASPSSFAPSLSASTMTQPTSSNNSGAGPSSVTTTTVGNSKKRGKETKPQQAVEPARKRAARGKAATAKKMTGSAKSEAAATNGKRKMTPMAAFKTEEGGGTGSSSGPASSAAASAKKKADAAEKFKRNSRACTYCQRLKMKCSGPTADGPCERCRRTGRECMVQERAPRRPWTKKKDLQIQQLTTRLEEMEGMLRNVFNSSGGGNTKEVAALAAQLQSIKKGKAEDSGEEDDDDDDDDDDDGDGEEEDEGQDVTQSKTSTATVLTAKPSAVGTGPSSSAINNWLTLTNAPSTPSATIELDLAYVDGHRELLPFLSTGKVSAAEAVDMFRVFMHSCVLHTAVLDPEWHTVARVGDASPFLFAVILYIASTYHRERRTLRSELHDEMNVLIGQAITTGPKSIEVVQAFLLLYQWYSPTADPSEDRAWLLAGIGIRLATELQLHKPLRGRASVVAAPAVETDRERINRERCWLMAFLVDRSLSIAVGRSWSISERAEVVRDSERWHKQPASRIWDRCISAFADLLKTTSRQADVLHTTITKRMESRDEGGPDDDFDCDTMMRIMNDELESWRIRWLSRDFYIPFAGMEAPEGDGVGARHAPHDDQSSASSSSATVNTDALDTHTRALYYVMKQASLRFNFAVLVLNSFGLQYCSTRPRLVHARTYCVTHAVRAAQGLLKAARDGIGNTMTYAPHTQFTILSFGVISLIKLATLVDDVVAERLIEQVRSCSAFLESIAIASDHTPARLASLVRAMVRRRDERKALRANRSATRSKRSESDAGAGVSDVANGVATTAAAAAHPIKAESSDSDSDGDSDEDDGIEQKANFAPGMDLHKLPQRSSRAVTPEGQHNLLSHDEVGGQGCAKGHAAEQGALLHDSTAKLKQHVAVSDSMAMPATADVMQAQQMPTDLLAADAEASLWAMPSGVGRSAMDGTNGDLTALPHFNDADVESTLQSLGFMANVGTVGWQQMTAEEILDDSFWLRLPDRDASNV